MRFIDTRPAGRAEAHGDTQHCCSYTAALPRFRQRWGRTIAL